MKTFTWDICYPFQKLEWVLFKLFKFPKRSFCCVISRLMSWIWIVWQWKEKNISFEVLFLGFSLNSFCYRVTIVICILLCFWLCSVLQAFIAFTLTCCILQCTLNTISERIGIMSLSLKWMSSIIIFKCNFCVCY